MNRYGTATPEFTLQSNSTVSTATQPYQSSFICHSPELKEREVRPTTRCVHALTNVHRDEQYGQPVAHPEHSLHSTSHEKLVLAIPASNAPTMEHEHANMAVALRPKRSARQPPTSMEQASLSVAVALRASSCVDESCRSSRMYCSVAARLRNNRRESYELALLT